MEKRMSRHLRYEDRKMIEAMLADGYNASEIADRLGVHRSTIFRECKRVTPYSADEAQKTVNS